MRLNQGKDVLDFVVGGKPENAEKTLEARTKSNNKLNLHMTVSPGIKPRSHWWEASALTDVPFLLPKLTKLVAKLQVSLYCTSYISYIFKFSLYFPIKFVNAL